MSKWLNFLFTSNDKFVFSKQNNLKRGENKKLWVWTQFLSRLSFEISDSRQSTAGYRTPDSSSLVFLLTHKHLFGLPPRNLNSHPTITYLVGELILGTKHFYICRKNLEVTQTTTEYRPSEVIRLCSSVHKAR